MKILNKKISRTLGKKIPDIFNNVIYKPSIKYFLYHAGTITLDDDGNLHFEGPEAEILKEAVEAELGHNKSDKFTKNSLIYHFGEGTAYCGVFVTPDDERYYYALQDALPLGYSYTWDGYYPVHSIEDVHRLDREYEESRKKTDGEKNKQVA